MYLWLNSSAEGFGGGIQLIDWDGGSSTYVDFATDTLTLDTISASGAGSYIIDITPEAGFENVSYKVLAYNNGELYSENEYTGTSQTIKNQIQNEVVNIQFFIESSDAFSYTALLRAKPTSIGAYEGTTASVNSLQGQIYINNNLPKIKTIDFLTGLFKMFKLVVVAEDNGTIYINTINDYYADGSVHNLTKYIDTENVDIERGKLLNPINFNFQEPTTLLNTQFEKNTGQAYGDEELILEDEAGEQLDGESYEVQLPFEQIVYERLKDLVDKENTNIMYAGVFDETIAGQNPKPHLYYSESVSIGSKTIAFINDSGIKEELTTSINIPSHTLGFVEPQFSTVFGKEVNEWNGEVIQNTIYSNYYSNYITSVFNIKKRVFKYSAYNLPLRIRLSLRLNDVIQIQEDFYRIDKFSTNLLTGKTSFDLINSFDNVINGFNADRTIVTVNYQAQTDSIYVTNGGNFSFNKVDTGNGISWVDVSSIGSNVYFEFEQNLTVLQRSMQVEITNTLTLQVITVTLIQTDGAGVTADNNVITVDNNLITADNSI